MFIHIGNDSIIQSRNIISIIEKNVIASSSIMEEMIEYKRKNNQVIGKSKKAKSVVIMIDFIYFSPLSVTTLKKRSSIASMIKKAEDYSTELD